MLKSGLEIDIEGLPKSLPTGITILEPEREDWHSVPLPARQGANQP